MPSRHCHPPASFPASYPLAQNLHQPLQDHNSVSTTSTYYRTISASAHDGAFAPTSNFAEINRNLNSNPKMPSFQNMDSAALVAAALGPELLENNKPGGQHPMLSTYKSDKFQQLSSPLTELSDNDFSSDTGRRTSELLGSKRRRLESRTTRRESAMHEDSCAMGDDHRILCEVSHKTRSRKEKTPLSSDKSEIEVNPCLHRSTTKYRKSKNGSRKPKRLIRKKPQGIRVPQTLTDATEVDQMLWHWKNEGKNWEEIRQQWCHMTGTMPGQSTLSVRYIKLNENFARHGAAGNHELLRFKREAEEELKTQIWARVADKMKAYSDLSEYNPKDLKKRYDAMMRSGRVVDPRYGSNFTEDVIKDEDENEYENEDGKEREVEGIGLQATNPTILELEDDIDMELATHDLRAFTTTDVSATKIPRQGERLNPTYQGDIHVSARQPNVWYEADATARTEVAPASKSDKGQHEQIVIGDDFCNEVLPELPQHSMSDLTVLENSSVRLPSSPFFKNLVAYTSDDE